MKHYQGKQFDVFSNNISKRVKCIWLRLSVRLRGTLISNVTTIFWLQIFRLRVHLEKELIVLNVYEPWKMNSSNLRVSRSRPTKAYNVTSLRPIWSEGHRRIHPFICILLDWKILNENKSKQFSRQNLMTFLSDTLSMLMFATHLKINMRVKTILIKVFVEPNGTKHAQMKYNI